jgi:hypothetical protein
LFMWLIEHVVVCLSDCFVIIHHKDELDCQFRLD